MSKYVNLDIAIMSKLSETPSPFSRLFSGDVGAECVNIAKDEGDKKSRSASSTADYRPCVNWG